MIMAEQLESARRREIRKRKILENSEARLKKIFGRDTIFESAHNGTDDLFSAESSEFVAKHVHNNLISVKPTLDSISETNSPCSNDQEDREDEEAEEEEDEEEERSCDSGGATVNGVSGRSSAILNKPRPHQSVPNAYEFPKKVSDTESRSYCRSKSDSHRRNSCTQLVLDTLQIDELNVTVLRPWIVILLAAFVRFWLIWDTNMIFMMSIFVPFFTLESGLFVYSWLNQTTYRSPQSLLMTALLLCGVPPAFVTRVSRQVNFAQTIIKDAAIYVFFFTLFHVVCQVWFLQ